MKEHRLDQEQIHQEWNNALASRLTIDPGDTVVFDTRDAANLFYTKASTSEDVIRRGPFRGHPLTGPVAVRGARPGDTLVVEILDVQPALDWGWTAIRPGRGLLPERRYRAVPVPAASLSSGATSADSPASTFARSTAARAPASTDIADISGMQVTVSSASPGVRTTSVLEVLDISVRFGGVESKASLRRAR